MVMVMQIVNVITTRSSTSSTSLIRYSSTNSNTKWQVCFTDLCLFSIMFILFHEQSVLVLLKYIACTRPYLFIKTFADCLIRIFLNLFIDFLGKTKKFTMRKKSYLCYIILSLILAIE